MAKILLDYFFPITAITPTPAASTAFLKQACVVVTPKGGYGGVIGELVLCTTNAQIEAVTDNDDAKELLSAGMSRVYLLPVNDLYLDTFLEGHESDFYTVIISSDFDKDDINATKATGSITITSYANLVSGTDDTITIEGVAFTAQAGAATLGEATFQAATSNDATAASLAAQINAHAVVSELVVATVLGAVVTLTAVENYSPGNSIGLSYTDNDTNVGATLAGLSGGNLSGGDGLSLGDFSGVVAVCEDDDSFNATQAAIANRCAFHNTADTDGKNMCYAFGKLLSNSSDWKNQQYITMPYEDDVDTLGEAMALFDDKVSFVISDEEFAERLALLACGGEAIVAPYVSKNLQVDLQSEALQYVSGNQPNYTKTQAALLEDELQKVVDSYVTRGWISEGVVEVSLEADNFVATADINIAKPKALWRIEGEMRQTLDE